MKSEFIIFVIAVISTTVSGQGEPTCDPTVVTWHPHPFTCTRYFICFHGNPVERLCAPGLHFSKEFEHCTYPQLARCDASSKCPEEDDENSPVFLPDPEDCSGYFVCFKGSPIPRKCAEDLWWDVVYNWCTIAEEVTCDSRTPNNPNAPTEPPATEPPTLPPTQPPPTTPPPTNPPTTTPDPNTMDCPLGSDVTFHPHSIDCHRYFICVNGIGFLRECAEGLIFDIIQRQCYDPELATCISGLKFMIE